ncbi:MAG: hypothetical protein ACRCX7_11325 [Cetobacterium sp.]|uniref:hypothetical protein n=1 Tax=Cetobacterium sp. TaxID=2071632 RepID=UPI003F395381
MFRVLFGKKYTSANIMEFVDKAVSDLQEEANDVVVKAEQIQAQEEMLAKRKLANEEHGKKVNSMINKINRMFGEEN